VPNGRLQTRLKEKVENRMAGEEGNGKEAGGSTPAGASLHPSAVHAQPIKGRIAYWGDPGENRGVGDGEEWISRRNKA